MKHLQHERVNDTQIDPWAMLDSIPDGLAILDINGTICYLNAAWQQQNAALSQHSAIGSSYIVSYAPLFTRCGLKLDAIIQGMQRVLTGTHSSFDFCYTVENVGVQHTFVVTMRPYVLDTTPAVLVQQHEQATERGNTNTRKHCLQTLLRHVHDLVLVLDIDRTILYASPAASRTLGYAPADMEGKPIQTFLHEDDATAAEADFARILEYPGRIQHMGEYRMQRTDGTWCFLEAVANSLLDDPAIQGVVVNCHDITERKATEEYLQRIALYDGLTGLPNRAFLMQRLQQIIEQTRQSPERRFAMLFIDLDNFKVVNDSLGHLAGDEFLKGITARLRKCLRSDDMIARLGGDEFTVLLEELQHPDDATEVAERIQKALIQPFYLQGHEMFATASIGIAIGSVGYNQAQDLLRDADTAMYHAKDMGKARYALFDEHMHARAMERLLIQSELQRSVDRNELRVYYQPIIALPTGNLVGFEALMRWQHPQHGLLEPSDFAAVAEETGSIVSIGWWVIREACERLRQWQQQFPHAAGLRMGVNLSGKQFKQLDLVDTLDEVLQETGLSADHIMLEVREGAILEQSATTANTIARLEERGIRLCIDDFGTGYASLSYLHQFPIHHLKIDGSFVQRMKQDAKGNEIVQVIVALARTLGMKVIAECVETPEQVVRLQELGCDYVQGYFFSVPLDRGKVEALLATTNRWTMSGEQVAIVSSDGRSQ